MEINHVLIVEDDKEIREGVQIYLQSQGYVVFQAADGIEGLEILEKEEIHLAIIDIMMPRMDGIRMTMKLREKYDFPVIMLSAKSEEVDKITGLNIGADDYVTKPFTPMELMARVNSQLRRYRKFLEKLAPQENTHVIGGLEINEDMVEVSMDGNPVKLTPIEYKILLLLAKNPGRVFSAEEIYERVWQEKAINTDTIMVHVRNIREKIEIDPKNPKVFEGGVGRLDTKSKNSRKFGILILILLLAASSAVMMLQYGTIRPADRIGAGRRAPDREKRRRIWRIRWRKAIIFFIIGMYGTLIRRKYFLFTDSKGLIWQKIFRL